LDGRYKGLTFAWPKPPAINSLVINGLITHM
jgi:hypothetical protein